MTDDTITKEQSFLLKVIASYIRNTDISVPDDIDISALKKISRTQQTAAIVYHQTKIPELRSDFSNAVYRAAKRNAQLEMIGREMKDHAIPYLVFKGTETAKYYPNPCLRISGDADILVRPRDKEKAGAVLEKTGFAPSNSTVRDHERIYYCDGFETELHHRLLYQDYWNNDLLTAFTDTVWEHSQSEDGICHHMEPEFHFVYLLLHLRKHLLAGDVTIRSFADLAVMLENARLDIGKTEKYMEECGATLFAKTCFAFIERWFGVASPFGTRAITDAFFNSAGSSILKSRGPGEIGREEMLNNCAVNITRQKGKIASCLSVLFPGRGQMQNKYPAAGHYSVLLPVLWIRRMTDSVRNHTFSNAAALFQKCLLAGDTEKKKENYLKSWGL